MARAGTQARHVGIVVKHRARCASKDGGRCNCRRIYQAAVWSARDAKRIRKHFGSLMDAKTWRAESYGRLRRRQMRPASRITFAEAAERWIAGARAGSVLTRSGDPYKPSTIRSYELSLRGPRDRGAGLIGELGSVRLSEISFEDLQAYVDRLLAAGAQPSTIRNAVMPLRVIFRARRREVPVNPTDGLALPAVRQRRVEIASPQRAQALLAALRERDRALWATAMYAGLRRGELMALRWADVDLSAGVIEVLRAWDPKEQRMIAPKSAAGTRRVPIAAALRVHLAPAQLAAPTDPQRLVFGSGERPFSATSVSERARRAWRRAGLEPICLHDCRHTFASLMIAAGVNAKALSSFMGHANISITLDRYGHLMPGAEDEAAGLMDAYLERAIATASER
ncbi:MAG TPA: site-specific integrase [Solirubrobacteraceae bacterium]|jgi:integrase|nr:site-specific integrase [Solirubrobacteraceae bacterium]